MYLEISDQLTLYEYSETGIINRYKLLQLEYLCNFYAATSLTVKIKSCECFERFEDERMEQGEDTVSSELNKYKNLRFTSSC